MITAVAGGPNLNQTQDGVLPSLTQAYSYSIATGPDGAVYFAEGTRLQIREIAPPVTQLNGAATSPVISLASGSYSSAQTVTITAQNGATIYLTFDGSEPTGASPIYHGSVIISGSITLKAIAIAPGYLPSASQTANYTITAAAPTTINTVARGQFGGAALDTSNNLYLVDSSNEQIVKVAGLTGKTTVIAGNGTAGYRGDGGLASAAQFRFSTASGIVVNAAGDVYIADSLNNRVRKIDAPTGVVTTVACTGTIGFSGDGGQATLAQCGYPWGLALDTSGSNLYLVDSNNSIVRKVELSTGVITTVAGTPRSSGYSGDGGPATSAVLSNPMTVVVDQSGNLYIGLQSRIREVLAADGSIRTIAGNGNPGATGDNGPALNAPVNPRSLALSGEGDLYLSNYDAEVRRISANTGIITTVAGNGYRGYWGDGGPADNAGLNLTWGIVFDSAGNLIISDNGNQNVREVTRPMPPPTFSRAGGTYTSAQTVAISDTNPNATIYFTTNGVTPTTGSTVYSGPISISSTETLQAMAAVHLYQSAVQSAVTSASYEINYPAGIPSFTPVGGTYSSVQTVSISSATPNASIYYTIDGSVPTTSSTLYAGAITVSTTETIKAVAIASGYSLSSVGSATYTISILNPTAALTAISPAYSDQGSTAFTLSVTGTGFLSTYRLLGWDRVNNHLHQSNSIVSDYISK